MTRKHAILSASAAHRWLACTPSARLEEKEPEQVSAYAEEGTEAHATAEALLKEYLETGKIDKTGINYYILSYVDFVVERINAAKNPVVLIEQRLDFSPWVPEGFGTGDVVIISDGTLEIIDLKYGKGVPISAENNPQIRLYALGALNLFGYLYDVETVVMTIVQPRLDSITTEEMTAQELLDWAEEYVKPRAKLAWEGAGEFKAGEHCRFCRVRQTCRARAEYNLELARYDFKKPELLEDHEVAEILDRAEELARWAADVQEYALTQAVHGKKWPGYKLVEGRSVRRITDEAQAVEKLKAAGLAEDDIYKKSLVGVTALEKLLGKKRFNEILGDLVEKPPGKPTLVPENDKRPEINSAEADFNG